MKYVFCTCIFTFLSSIFNSAYTQDLYYSSGISDLIVSAKQDGSGSPTTLFDSSDGIDNPRGVAADLTNNKIYWSDLLDNDIKVGNLDGSGSATVLFSGLDLPTNIAIDPINNKIYWSEATNSTSDRIMVGNLDGSGSPSVVFSNVDARGIVVDATNAKLYWAEVNNDNIKSGNSDGSGVPVILFNNATDGISKPYGLAVDLVNSKIYWSEINAGGNGNNRIAMGNLDGSGSPTVLFDNPTDGVNNPREIAINTNTNEIFWTEIGSDAIKSGNIDGSGSPTTLFSSLNRPIGLTISGHFVLPVNLVDFTVKEEQNKVRLEWFTLSEQNNKKFEIEYSFTGRDFEKLGEVEGSGTTFENQRYSFSHYISSYSGNLYYRLKQIDYDGRFGYSPVISIYLNNENGKKGKLYPNPSALGKVTLELPELNGLDIQVSVYDILGKLLFDDVEIQSQGPGIFELDFSRLGRGTFIIKTSQGNFYSFEKLVIQ